MAKRKIFAKTDISAPYVAHEFDADKRLKILEEHLPPRTTTVRFSGATGARKAFDFAPWYGVEIDQITYACQRQIERFLAKQDAEVEEATIVSYCTIGLAEFFEYLVQYTTLMGTQVGLNDINRELVDGYLTYLQSKGISSSSQKSKFQFVKSILGALGKRGLIEIVAEGDNSTFPRNPFHNINRTEKGEKPLPRAHRKAVAAALRQSVLPLFAENATPTGELLSYALLMVALYTGRNTTPLLEMSPDCLRPHPKNDMKLLVLYKRRGHSFSKVALRADPNYAPVVESTSAAKLTIVQLILRVIELTQDLREEASGELKDRAWVYRSLRGSRGTVKVGEVIALRHSALGANIQKLVNDHDLRGANGKLLRLNVGRLRKTFANRVNEILEGDLVTTAIALGNTPQVTAANYLRPGEDAQKNWRFMGQALVEELLTKNLGMTEKTLTGRCTDTKNGQYAPRRDGATCMSFLNCLRCRNYVVTGDDLYRLFSFYWRVLRERTKMDNRRWDRQFAYIIKLIDRDVIAPGIAKGVFKQQHVEETRQRARDNPHPYWRADSMIHALQSLR